MSKCTERGTASHRSDLRSPCWHRLNRKLRLTPYYFVQRSLRKQTLDSTFYPMRDYPRYRPCTPAGIHAPKCAEKTLARPVLGNRLPSNQQGVERHNYIRAFCWPPGWTHVMYILLIIVADEYVFVGDRRCNRLPTALEFGQ